MNAGRLVASLSRRVKPYFPTSSFVGHHLRRLRSALPPAPSPWVQTRLLEDFARAYPEARVLQIGANDGQQLDPLRRHLFRGRWHAVLVEPVPFVHDQLARNTRRLRRVVTANLAVAEHDGTMPFFHLREADAGHDLPRWYDAIGSFDRDVVARQVAGRPELEARLVATEVPCLTFESLCERFGIDRLDLLHIDTEGYDYRILRQVDLDRLAPRVVLYEHHLLGDDKSAARDLLEEHGYVTFDEEGIDTLGIRREADSMRDRWLLERFEQLTQSRSL